MSHECSKHDKFEDIAGFMGGVHADMASLKADVNRLFKQGRERAEIEKTRDEAIMRKLNSLDKKTYAVEMKIGLFGIVCGGAGSIAAKYFFEGVL